MAVLGEVMGHAYRDKMVLVFDHLVPHIDRDVVDYNLVHWDNNSPVYMVLH